MTDLQMSLSRNNLDFIYYSLMNENISKTLKTKSNKLLINNLSSFLLGKIPYENICL